MDKDPRVAIDLLALIERALPVDRGDVEPAEALMLRVGELVDRARRQALCLRFEELFEKVRPVASIEFDVIPRQGRRNLKLNHKAKFSGAQTDAAGPPLTPKQVTELRADFFEAIERWADLESKNQWHAIFSCAPSQGGKAVGERVLGEEGYASWLARREGAKIAQAAREPESRAARARPRI